jgi:uncharacterized protein (TIGR03437 family)
MERMFRAWLALAILFGGVARGAAPSYSAAGIVKAGSFAPGPFAPNSIVSIFGSGLARSTQGITSADIVDHHLPTELNGTQVRVSGFMQVPLFYVSDAQVNFLMPSNILTGPADIRVVCNGQVGPPVTVTVGDAAPALFAMPNGFAIVTHADSSLITPEAPARAGEVIVIYAAGLGKTERVPIDGELPAYISYLLNWKSTKVLLNGVAVDADRMSYAGLTPASAGLYQINVQLPESVPIDPELRVAIGDQTSQAGVKLALH